MNDRLKFLYCFAVGDKVVEDRYGAFTVKQSALIQISAKERIRGIIKNRSGHVQIDDILFVNAVLPAQRQSRLVRAQAASANENQLMAAEPRLIIT